MASWALFGALCASDTSGAQTSTPKISYLHVFNFVNDAPPYGDATAPFGRLIQAADGNFYGTTNGVGDEVGAGWNGGVVYSITPKGNITILHQFLGEDDGEYPSDIIQGSDGNFYGETNEGGDYGFGSIFKITPAGRLTTLYSFPTVYNSSGGINPQGENPEGGLIQGSDGNFYGVAFDGGSSSYGTVFKISMTGAFTVLHDFSSSSDGAFPQSHLLQASDGNFYGTTSSGACPDPGCDEQDGGIFKVSASGTLTFIYKAGSATATAATNLPLIEGPGQSLFGVSNASIFLTSFSGNVSTVFSFTSAGQGLDPGELFLGADRNLYGSSFGGGITTGFSCGYGCGTVFQVTPAGGFTNYYDFPGYPTGGSSPAGPPAIAADGQMYGTDNSGGTSMAAPLDGAIYKLTFPEAFTPPVTLSLSDSTITLGQSTKLSWNAYNSFSTTMQQCFAFIQNGASGGGTWTGLQAGSMANDIYTGSTTLIPTDAGTFTYALTCGGVESGFATLVVTNTATSLSAKTNPIVVGQQESLFAAVSDAGVTGTPTGIVTFSSGTVTLGKARLNSAGVATLIASTTNVAPGAYPVKASYGGDPSHTPSTSAVITVMVESDENSMVRAPSQARRILAPTQ